MGSEYKLDGTILEYKNLDGTNLEYKIFKSGRIWTVQNRIVKFWTLKIQSIHF